MSKIFKVNFMQTLSLAAMCFFLAAGQTALAQSTVTGGIRGTVNDPQGAVIPNVSVTVTNTGTNSTQTVTTDDNGNFVANNLQPGSYRINITQTGFEPFTADNVVVEVGQVTTVNVPLGVTGASATVEVTAEAPVINTNSQDFSTNINQTSINELPINGRRASNFVLLTPATVPDGTFGLISFRGISGLLNNSTVDGGDNNQAFFSEERGRTRINYVISQSAVREFQVNGANYSAEYGRAAGGVINTVTKSGTNQFSGELFYYNRNNRNGARNPRAFRSALINGVPTTVAAKPIDLRQQFGGAIGGPIIKDKVFFFFSYDQQKRNFPGLSSFQNASFANLSAANRTTLLSRGLTNAQIDTALNFVNSLTGETPRRGDQKLFLPKIDWQINENNQFSATYNRLRWESPAGVQTQAVNTLGRRSFGDDGVKVDTLNLRLQSTFSSNLLNEARFQYGRDFEFQTSQTPLPGEPVTASTTFGPRAPNVDLGSNGLAFGTPTFLERPAYPDERRIQFADTLTFIRGRHTFKFGLDINRVSDDTQNLRFEAGSYQYNNNLTDFIIDYTNYLTPLPAGTACATTTRLAGRCYNGNFAQGVGVRGIKFNTYDYNFFVQDDFRITPRLTLNLGLRYEYQKLPEATLANNTLYKDVTIPNTTRTFAQATSQLPNDKNNFGPRVGFAYDIFGDSKTSIRGGYGIYYGRIINSTIYNALINTGNPGGQAQIFTAVTAANAPIFPNVPTATINPNATTPLGAIQFFAEDFQAPLIHQYDLIFEREIFNNTVVSASYVGSTGRNLPAFIDRNFNQNASTARTVNILDGPFAGQNFSIPVYPRVFGTQALTEIQSSVNSEYNALVLQANRRFSNGIQFQTSYTYSKSTDTGQASTTFTVNNSTLDVFNRLLDSGPSNFDVRHKFVVSAVFAPTLYKGSANSIYNYLLNGFSIAPIYALYSGQPYNATVGGVTNALNGTNGNSRLPIISRNAYRLPNLSNLDIRGSKRFRFGERFNLEFLAEVFNVFNRTHVFGVNTQLYSGTTVGNTVNLSLNRQQGVPQFGLVTTTDSTIYRERQVQFATRFQF
jgi:outer membrane receptor protein involved in Fe transport